MTCKRCQENPALYLIEKVVGSGRSYFCVECLNKVIHTDGIRNCWMVEHLEDGNRDMLLLPLD